MAPSRLNNIVIAFTFVLLAVGKLKNVYVKHFNRSVDIVTFHEKSSSFASGFGFARAIFYCLDSSYSSSISIFFITRFINFKFMPFRRALGINFFDMHKKNLFNQEAVCHLSDKCSWVDRA